MKLAAAIFFPGSGLALLQFLANEFLMYLINNLGQRKTDLLVGVVY